MAQAESGTRLAPFIQTVRGAHCALQTDLFDLILLNVRVPEERRGDYFAQVVACRLGERRMQALAGRHGYALLQGAFDEIIARTERRLREAMARIPLGSYRFSDVRTVTASARGKF